MNFHESYELEDDAFTNGKQKLSTLTGGAFVGVLVGGGGVAVDDT